MRALVIYASSGCNQRCKHCGVGADQIRPRHSISIDKMRSIAARASVAGIQTITVLGGEITHTRPDFEGFLEAASSYGLRVSINTNLTIYSAISSYLRFPAVSNITVSLDGVSSQTHDLIRGRGQFVRTDANIRRLMTEDRIISGDVTLDLTFCLNRLNRSENMDIIKYANSVKANKLNFEVAKIKGSARKNSNEIELEPKELLVALVEAYLYWRMEGITKFDFYIPPLLGAFFKERFGIIDAIINSVGCGGPEVYGYIDNNGNHFPCPSMAFENNRKSNSDKSFENLDVTAFGFSSVWDRSVFRGFERARASGALRSRQHPCRQCAFASICSPCTSDVLEDNKDARVEICAAIYSAADDFLPDFRAKYLSE